jgi:hypothetical protein
MSDNVEHILDRILRERLDQFKVPVEVRNEIAQEFLSIMGRPERTKYGAAIMTPEASLAADKQRERGARGDDAKPKII